MNFCKNLHSDSIGYLKSILNSCHVVNMFPFINKWVLKKCLSTCFSFFRVATVIEKSGKNEIFSRSGKNLNFVFGQGNLEFCSKLGKSQGNLYHFGYFKGFLTFIERLNKKKMKNMWSMLCSLKNCHF